MFTFPEEVDYTSWRICLRRWEGERGQ